MITSDNSLVNSQRNLFGLATVTLMIISDYSLENFPRNTKEC